MAATVAEKLITQSKVLVLTGGRASGQAVEIASVAQRLKTPYVVDHPSADIITAKGFEWVFRNNPTGSIYPQAFNKFISEVPGAMPKSAAVVYDNSVFGKTISNSAMDNLTKTLEAAGCTIKDLVSATRYLTDVKEQDDLNRVWAERLGGHLPTTTTVEVSRLATHPNCKIEISAIAVADATPARARGKLSRPRGSRKSRSSHRTR